MSIQDEIHEGMKTILSQDGNTLDFGKEVTSYEENEEWRGGGCPTCQYEQMIVRVYVNRNRSYIIERPLQDIIDAIENSKSQT